MRNYKHLYSIYPLLVMGICLCSTSVHAQTDTARQGRQVQGVLTSSTTGTTIPGAAIKIKNTGQQVVTDEKGAFRLLAKPTDTLVITAIGFKKLEAACGNKPLLALSLPEEQKDLNEVMVIGYGNERKRNITGSIVSINASDLEKASALSFDNAIIGKAAGVQILTSSGVPGSATAITIRGLSTLSSDGNHPLIVIDGIPAYGSGKNLNNHAFNATTSPLTGFGGTSVSDNLTTGQEFENNPLAALNPADIESIEILKDAYATSIYGSRGAAGVILVTTKKGSKSKPMVNVRYLAGTIQPIGKYQLLNGPQYNEIYTTYYKQLGQNQIFNSPYNTDWQKAVTRTAFSQQADASVAAGGEKAQYFISGSYASQPSYIINADYKRYTGRINLTYNASDAVKMGINMSMAYTNNSAMNAPYVYATALKKAPNLPIQNADGSYAYGKGSNPFGDLDGNPVADALLNTNTLQSTEQLANAWLQFKPVSWLSVRSEFGTQLSGSDAYTRRVKKPSGYGDDAIQNTSQNRKIVVNNTITYLNTPHGGHYINAVAGQSFERSTETNTGVSGYGFFSDAIRTVNAATRSYVTAALTQRWAMVSYFGRLNYEYRSKYLAGVTYRIDGSSRFGSNRRYQSFPSFSAGWRISKEAFLQPYKWIDDIKLRGSIGFAGNNSATSYYGSQGQYNLNSNNLTYAGVPILEMAQPDNPNLKWERTRSVDLGLDMTFLNNRYTVTFDYYERRIKDMLLASAIPLYQGWTIQSQNIGDMVNRGLELTVNAQLVTKKSFSWSANVNASRNTNKVLKLTNKSSQAGSSGDAFKYLKEGEAAGQFFLYDWQGVDAMSGNPVWGDNKGGTSVIPPASRFAQVADVNDFRRPYGTSLPAFYGGMGHSLHYKNWDLDVFFSFSAGGKMMNASKAALLTYATADANNLSTLILNNWLVPGHQTDIPKLVNSSITVPAGSASGITDYTTSRTSSRFLEDASYIRMRTISLAYNINPAQLQRLTGKLVRMVQVFARGTNLLTITGYSGVDPEVNVFGSSALQSGYDQLGMPQNKLYQFGFNIGL